MIMKEGIMKRGALIFVLIILITSFGSYSVWAEAGWTVFTEELPPYNFVQNGVVRGFSTDILLKLFQKNNIALKRKDIRVLPWARAYQMVQEIPGTILFSMARTAERENLFKWVGPILHSTSTLIARKDRKIRIENIADLARFKVGTVRESEPDQYLLRQGVPEQNLDRITSGYSNMKKLQAGRIDILAFDALSTRFFMEQKGLDSDRYEVVLTLTSRPLYYAFNKETDDKLIAVLNTTLQEMKKQDAEGHSLVSQIVKSYL